MTLKVGGLFAGYGGLELALGSVLDCEPAWFSEFEAAPSKILAHHWPDVPNLGDVTRIDWHTVEPVDVITGGSPCQDLSHAGKRAGMKAGTRSGLWASMCDAIDIIRPRLVVWENVRGALSAEADSELEHCPGCMGDGGSQPVLRALGRVLGDLADLGYDAWWYGLRAADVGAAHGRFRIFLFAQPADTDLPRLEGRGVRGERRGERSTRESGLETVEHVPGQLALLPTPAVNDMGKAYTPEEWDAWTARMKSEHGNGNGHGKSLEIEAQRLLPTPTTNNRTSEKAKTGRATSGPSRGGPSYGLEDVAQQDWREYEPAIRRQEQAFGRRAPLPTEPGKTGKPRLSPRFVEWLMGLPDGWVTDVPGITRKDALKALGNGVCPPQAAAATWAFLHDISKETAA